MSIQKAGVSNAPYIGDKPATDHGVKPLTVTFQTARCISGLGLTTLWGLAKAKRIDVVRVGRRTVITYASLERLLSPGGAQPAHGQVAAPRRGRPPKLARAAEGASP